MTTTTDERFLCMWASFHFHAQYYCYYHRLNLLFSTLNTERWMHRTHWNFLVPFSSHFIVIFSFFFAPRSFRTPHWPIFFMLVFGFHTPVFLRFFPGGGFFYLKNSFFDVVCLFPFISVPFGSVEVVAFFFIVYAIYSCRRSTFGVQCKLIFF